MLTLDYLKMIKTEDDYISGVDKNGECPFSRSANIKLSILEAMKKNNSISIPEITAASGETSSSIDKILTNMVRSGEATREKVTDRFVRPRNCYSLVGVA